MEGALGKEQLDKLEMIVENRRKNGAVFEKLFSDIEGIRIQKSIGKASYFGFAIIVDENAKFTREQLVNELRNQGVECRPIVAGNFIKNEVIKYFNYEIFGQLTNADIIHDNGLFIGNHHFDITDKLKERASLIKNLA